MAKSTPNVPRWTWAQVCARRLERHRLAKPAADETPAGIAAAICGAHAQVMAAAELSLGLRLAGATRASIRAAVWDEHSLIKTYGPRGTVHLLPAQDLAMWTGALSALPGPTNSLPPGARLTPEQRRAVVAAIAEALSAAELTVDELTEAVVARTGPWAGERVLPAWQELWPRWRQAMGTAAHHGVMCFGPNRGSKVTYTNPRRWLPGFRPERGSHALPKLARRYLRAYGPATPEHFAQWLAMPRRLAAELFASISAELQPVDANGARAWLLAEDDPAPPAPRRAVQLLPYFDAYVVGSHPRERLFPGVAVERALSRGQAGNFPVLLIGGTVAGIWHQRRAGRALELTVEPFGRLSPAQRRALDRQAARIGEFLEAEPRLTIGLVTVGRHG